MITVTFSAYNTANRHPDRVIFLKGNKLLCYWSMVKIVYALYRVYGFYSLKGKEDPNDPDTIHVLDTDGNSIMSITLEESPTSTDSLAYSN